MLKKLIQFSLTQRLIILLLSALVIAGGWISFGNTPIDAYPDVSTTQVKIILKAPGMTPEEIEQRITALIEVEMLGLPNQSMLRSISKYALTDITIDFEEGTDIYWARQQVSERLNAIMEDLPPGVTGGIAPMTTPLGEMFMFTIEGDSMTLMEKRSLLDWVIRPSLRGVAGVADVNALGGHVKTFEIMPDNAALLAQGITISELIEAIEVNNKNDGAGRLNEGEEVLLVRTSGSITELADVENII
ncbi:MAG: efflux RND transporter permease subunit, partial [Kordiimonadaceae bacterium]|nr:efflux RND transporter permease subunit [Kordiimonadaceae bacterium]